MVNLREMLKGKNLPTNGTKAELVQRLLDAGFSREELCITEHTSDEAQLEEPQPGTSAQAAVSTLREIEFVRKERDLAAREAELLRRKLELLRMSLRQEKDASARASVKKWQELKDLVGEFNGNNLDYDQWEKQIKKLLSSYNLDDHRAKALVCNRLSGKALKWYHSRADCVELSHDNFLRELRRMYRQQSDQLALRRELEARVWNAGKSFADYLHDKVTLANRVPVSDTEVISYVIEGIPSQELHT